MLILQRTVGGGGRGGAGGGGGGGALSQAVGSIGRSSVGV